MKHITLFSTMALIAGLFAAGLAIGAGQQDHGQSPWDSSLQNQRVQMAQTELGVGTASGETQRVQSEYQEMAAQNLNKKQIRELQKLLNKQGYNAGPEDGVIGSQTKQALRQFQQSQGIAATGKTDEATLRALAPSAEQQEFFGLSPEFTEGEGQQKMQPEGQQMGPQPTELGVGSASGESKQ